MNYIAWLKRYSLPALGLTLMVMFWSGCFGLRIHFLQGITIILHTGQQASFWDVVLIEGVGCAISAAFVQLVVLTVLFIGRVPFRWGLLTCILLLIGTPVLYAFSNPMVQFFETRDDYGFLLGTPQVIMLLICWIGALALGRVIPRYRVVLIRVDDNCSSPCPRCGYDLTGSGGYECPECGWQIPRHLLAQTETATDKDTLSPHN